MPPSAGLCRIAGMEPIRVLGNLPIPPGTALRSPVDGTAIGSLTLARAITASSICAPAPARVPPFARVSEVSSSSGHEP